MYYFVLLFNGANAKLRKVTISFVMSVRSYGKTQLLLNGFPWYLIFVLVENLSRTFKFDYNMPITTGTFHEDLCAEFFLEWEMFQTNVVEKIKTHILCAMTFFFTENPAAYEITLNSQTVHG